MKSRSLQGEVSHYHGINQRLKSSNSSSSDSQNFSVLPVGWGTGSVSGSGVVAAFFTDLVFLTFFFGSDFKLADGALFPELMLEKCPLEVCWLFCWLDAVFDTTLEDLLGSEENTRVSC